jgi:uncharacterized protein (DUF885 family)
MNKKNFIGQVTTCLVLLLATLPVQADPGTELQQFFDDVWERELAMGTQAGFLFDLLYMVNKAPRASEADYLNYLARLEAIPEFLDQNTELMRAGLKRGMTQPRAIMGEIEALAAEFLVEDPRASIFWQPFADMPSSISAGQQ